MLCLDIQTPNGEPLVFYPDGEVQRRFGINSDDYTIQVKRARDYDGDIRVQYFGDDDVLLYFHGKFGNKGDMNRLLIFHKPPIVKSSKNDTSSGDGKIFEVSKRAIGLEDESQLHLRPVENGHVALSPILRRVRGVPYKDGQRSTGVD